MEKVECVQGLKQVTISVEGCNSEFFIHLPTAEFANKRKANYAFQCSKLKIISSLNNGT